METGSREYNRDDGKKDKVNFVRLFQKGNKDLVEVRRIPDKDMENFAESEIVSVNCTVVLNEFRDKTYLSLSYIDCDV
jgi:hypothetical protein